MNEEKSNDLKEKLQEAVHDLKNNLSDEIKLKEQAQYISNLSFTIDYLKGCNPSLSDEEKVNSLNASIDYYIQKAEHFCKVDSFSDLNDYSRYLLNTIFAKNYIENAQ